LTVFLLEQIIILLPTVEAYLPPQNPPWPPTYNVTESLITMQKNSSGWSSIERALDFGIVSYDWSNNKAQWAKSRPMDCEERLSEQAERLVAARREKPGDGTNSHVFLYRNLVKALPWFSTVRTKLLDPAYEGFFLKFDKDKTEYHVPRCAAENASVCSNFYHDQEQTPQVPTPDDPNPDGWCDPSYGCDCGPGLPCGEYYFDHRNGTMLRDWLIEEVVLASLLPKDSSSKDGTKTNMVDGLFMDDFWCSDLLCSQNNNALLGCPCNDPVQGPTESNKFAVQDMGLSDVEVLEITLEWNKTMSMVEQALLDNGAYTWWFMEGEANANAWPFLFSLDEHKNSEGESEDQGHGETRKQSLKSRSDRCVEILQDACREDSHWQTRPRLFGFSVVNGTQLLQFELDWAFFLLVRGPYTWAGWGIWGMTWPFNADPAHGELPPSPYGVPLPKDLTREGSMDYGKPLGVCYESSPSSGKFQRKWSNGWMIEIDCNSREKSQNGNQNGESRCNGINDCDQLSVKSQVLFVGDKVKDEFKIRDDPVVSG